MAVVLAHGSPMEYRQTGFWRDILVVPVAQARWATLIEELAGILEWIPVGWLELAAELLELLHNVIESAAIDSAAHLECVPRWNAEREQYGLWSGCVDVSWDRRACFRVPIMFELQRDSTLPYILQYTLVITSFLITFSRALYY